MSNLLLTSPHSHVLTLVSYLIFSLCSMRSLLYHLPYFVFRINEHNDLLRIITSQRQDDNTDWLDHQLFILQSNVANNQLEAIAQPLAKSGYGKYLLELLKR